MRYKDGQEARLRDIVMGPGFKQGIVVRLGDDGSGDCSVHLVVASEVTHGKCENFSLVWRPPRSAT